MGVRLGRKGREAGADYQKPLGGRLVRLLDVGNERLRFYGTPNVSKMSDTSAGMKTRRVCSASSAVVELSLQLRQLHSTVCFDNLFHSAKLQKKTEITKCFVEKSALSINKLQ